jgi:hypothetical protein
MLRYTCDLCGRDVADRRFVVKIEVFAAHDPAQLTDADLDDDPIDSLSQILEEAGDDADLSDQLPPARADFRYDLCPACHKKYVRSPLRETDKKFHFSEN